MKRNELKSTEIYARFASEVHDDFGEVETNQEYYRKEQADSVMDELEERIKELQEENLAKDMLGAELHNENKELKSIAEKQQKLSMDRWFEIKALKARIAELESDLKTRDLWRESYLVEQKELYERIKELEATKPKWISVKDRLPKVDEYVLVFYNGSQDVCLLQEYSNGNIEWCDGEFNYPLKTFTHWMPLPEAPKSED